MEPIEKQLTDRRHRYQQLFVSPERAQRVAQAVFQKRNPSRANVRRLKWLWSGAAAVAVLCGALAVTPVLHPNSGAVNESYFATQEQGLWIIHGSDQQTERALQKIRDVTRLELWTPHLAGLKPTAVHYFESAGGRQSMTVNYQDSTVEKVEVLFDSRPADRTMFPPIEIDGRIWYKQTSTVEGAKWDFYHTLLPGSTGLSVHFPADYPQQQEFLKSMK